jgi:tRNA pseudouridine55 synthase
VMQSKQTHGLLLLNKPKGISSSAVVSRVKRLLKIKKCGHTGTLDVLATGMLPLCLGEATKLAGFLLAERKQYTVEATLGVATETGDAEGRVIKTQVVQQIDRETLEQVLAGFVGVYRQKPPMYSALKKDGKPLYAYARAGQVVKRCYRDVHLYRCQLLSFVDNVFSFQVECSKGTYIRVLAEDIAKQLNQVAFVSQLHRDWVFPHQSDNMLTLTDLEACVTKLGLFAAHWIPLESMIAHWPKVLLNEGQVKKIRHGVSLLMPIELGVSKHVRLFGLGGDIIGIGLWEQKVLRPKRLFLCNR